MTSEHYWSIVVKRWKLILTCFMVVGLGAFIASKLTTPIYQAEAIVQVAVSSSNSQADYNSLLASDQLVQTESQLATNSSVLGEVASHYPGLTEDQVAKEVSSTPSLNTQLFTITVLDPNPSRAAVLANDIATTLIKQQLQIVQTSDQHAQQQIQQQIGSTQQQINSVTNRIESLRSNGGGSAQIAVLQSQLNTLQQQYNQWETVLAQLELSQAQIGDFLRVAQPAQAETNPVRPVLLLNMGVGLAAGLFLGLLLAMLLEQLDTRVRSIDDLTKLLDWTVLGTIWRTRTTDRTALINPGERDANVEAYRILRTNVGFSSIDKPLHTLMVTSGMPGDGKSTVAANLAIFLAKAGKSTLLVDADLRRPVQHQMFKLSADKRGLSNAVMALSMQGVVNPTPSQFIPPGSQGLIPSSQTGTNFSLEPFVHTVGVPNLWVMPSGPLPPNPSELLDSKAMNRLLPCLENSGIEIVIFDAPPIRGLSDASIIASKVDGTLVVIDITRAHKKMLKQVKTQLSQVGSNVLGCIVNKEHRSRHDTSYSYYYYYRSQDQMNAAASQSVHASSEQVKIPHSPGQPVSAELVTRKKRG